jgi:hypothetical protein
VSQPVNMSSPDSTMELAVKVGMPDHLYRD